MELYNLTFRVLLCQFQLNNLVESDWVTKKGVDDVWVVIKLLVDHKGKDTHLGSTAVVELDGKLLVKGLLVPARCFDLGSLDLLLAGSKANLD